MTKIVYSTDGENENLQRIVPTDIYVKKKHLSNMAFFENLPVFHNFKDDVYRLTPLNGVNPTGCATMGVAPVAGAASVCTPMRMRKGSCCASFSQPSRMR